MKPYHKRRILESLAKSAFLTLILALLWLVVACRVFQLRHPCATKLDTLRHLDAALSFSKVPHKEIHP